MKTYKTKEKIILGLDPGSSTIGYGVISYVGQKLKLLGYGYIDLKEHKGDALRLVHLNSDLNELIHVYKPHCVAVENVYYFKNLKTVSPVMQSKGVILFTCAKAELTIFEYTPLQVKQTISGYGRADKNYLQKIVRSSLNVGKDIKPDDASDALAIALCHIRHSFGN